MIALDQAMAEPGSSHDRTRIKPRPNKDQVIPNQDQAMSEAGSSHDSHIVQELCEHRGGRPGLSVLTSLLVSVDVKIY